MNKRKEHIIKLLNDISDKYKSKMSAQELGGIILTWTMLCLMKSAPSVEDAIKFIMYELTQAEIIFEDFKNTGDKNGQI